MLSRISENCYILNDGKRCLMLDAGVSYTFLANMLDDEIHKVLGCLVSHEHFAHAQGVEEIITNGISAYMSAGTMNGIFDESDILRAHVFEKKVFDPFYVGPWKVKSFYVDHNSEEPTGFQINDRKTKLLYIPSSCNYKFYATTHMLLEPGEWVLNWLKKTNKQSLKKIILTKDYLKKEITKQSGVKAIIIKPGDKISLS